VQVYDIEKIMHPRTKLNTLEKIQHLIKLREALLSKLEMIRSKKLVIIPQNQTGGKRGRGGKSVYSHMMALAPGASLGNSLYSQAKGIEVEEEVESDHDEELVKDPPKVIGQGARVMIRQNKK
jgi:hypothetical protein